MVNAGRGLVVVAALASGCARSGQAAEATRATETAAPPASTAPAAKPDDADAPTEPSARHFEQCPDNDAAACRKQCDAGAVASCNALAGMFLFGHGMAPDAARGIQLREKACDGGYPIACAQLSLVHRMGSHGLPKNEAKADTLDARAAALNLKLCDEGYAIGCSGVADSFYDKDAAKMAAYRKRTTALYGRGCEQGHAASCGMFGLALSMGEGIAKDPGEAVKQLLRGCEGGDPASCSWAGGHFEEGAGVAVDLAKAKELYAKGCAGGIVAACRAMKR